MAANNSQAAVHEVKVLGIGVHDDIEIAQKLAHNYARQRAIYMLAQKWEVENLEKKLSRIGAETFDLAVRGVRILSFKREGNVLYAEAIVSIFDTPIKKALHIKPNIEDNSLKATTGILIIPVFKNGEEVLVFNRENPLRAPIRRATLISGNQSIVTPLGDNKDLSTIGADNILAARYDTFKPLLERYGAKEVMVALVDAPDPDSDSTRVLINRMYKDGMKPEILNVKAKEKSNLPARYQEVAQVITSLASKQAFSSAPAEREARQKLTKQPIIFRFSTMLEYAEIDNKLKQAPGVDVVEIQTIGLQQVDATFLYKGDLKPIRAFLDKKGVKLRERGAIWVLSKR